MQHSIHNLLGSIVRILRLVYDAAPRELINIILFSIITGSGPSVALYFSKNVIDELTKYIGQESVNLSNIFFSDPKLLFSLASMLILNILVDSLRPINNILFSTLRDGVKGYIKENVIEKVANFNDIALFEIPELLNTLKLAERGLQNIQEFIYILIEVTSGILILIPSILLSLAISWWIPLLLIITAIPSTFVDMVYSDKSWSLEKTQADTVRRMDSYESLMLSEYFAKEIRLLSLQTLLINQWKSMYLSLFQAMKQLRFEGAVTSFCCSLIEGFGIVIPYIHIVFGVIAGNYSLGDLALYTGLILQIRIGLRVTLNSFNNTYSTLLSIEPIFQLLDLQESIIDGNQSVAIQNETSISPKGLQINNLSFTYPACNKPTLKNINLKINPNEMIVIVGENGSGKTTLVKLLCRFYDPQKGKITLNSQEYKSLSLNELRLNIAVVMQDYVHFPATLRENVGWGNHHKLDDETIISDSLNKVGLKSLFDSLNKGLDTPLTKQIENGTDLSTGQWQRVAIARALTRLSQAKLLIFDEPTAAIDPKNEHEIYQILREVSKDRMTVVISHRLSLAKTADRIIVLEDGQVIEEGTQDKLFAQQGKYYDMFRQQSSYYV